MGRERTSWFRGIACLALLALVGVSLVSLAGCTAHPNRHRHCNPDGSITYYRFHRDYTNVANCRTIYHPNAHYYHCHY